MYNHKTIENKWKKYWIDNKSFKTDLLSTKQKSYILDMFPYPSGQGLHVGHPKGYTCTDVYARYKRMNGFSVLHPIGWDAFGLPAEQYAIQTGNHPESFTTQNINNFREQLIALGFSFDYDKEVNTTDPQYYKWTQWIFSKLFERGLAEIKDIDVNWCEGLQTVLANEEILIEDGKMVSERGGFPVIKKPMRQWVLKITEYADKLLEGLDELQWPESLKSLQTNWIGKSIGTEIDFTCNGEKMSVFTTRPDTLFGVTFLAIAPDHPKLNKLIQDEYKDKVEQYCELAKAKTLVQRQELAQKTGVFSGSYGINPINNKKVPIWVADYVLKDYANGIVMGVADADQRDWEFANKYDLPILQVIEGDVGECHCNDGPHINSEFLNGLDNKAAKELINKKLIEINVARIITNYKMKDWIFSRQRYWGEPFPILFDEANKPCLDKSLPLILPKTDNIKPTVSGESPLANIKDWLNVEIGGKKYVRETNTMPQWAGSCWYYIGYLMKKDDGSYLDIESKEAQKIFKKWLPVDLYVGGQEHAVLHLLYARFWHRFLYDIGVIPTKEPFYKIINQGMILGPDGEKMSKSKGNVINPNDIINDFGADTLRIYEMFMGPITATLPWSDNGLKGSRKWLDRVYRLITNGQNTLTNDISAIDSELNKAYHLFIKEVTLAIGNYQFNIAISKMMVYINECNKNTILCKEHLDNFLIVLSCFAPFIAEELYQYLNPKNNESIGLKKWPLFDEKYLVFSTINLPIQINGKLKDVITAKVDATQEEVEEAIKDNDKIQPLIKRQKIRKVIYVKNKILNIII